MTTVFICNTCFNEESYDNHNNCQFSICKNLTCNTCVYKWNRVGSSRTICCGQKIDRDEKTEGTEGTSDEEKTINSWLSELTEWDLEFTTIKCPKCGISIYKDYGCNNVECSIKKCKQKFYYCCGMPYTNNDKNYYHDCDLVRVKIFIADCMPNTVNIFNKIDFLNITTDAYSKIDISKLINIATKNGAVYDHEKEIIIAENKFITLNYVQEAFKRFSVPSLPDNIISNKFINKKLNATIKWKKIRENLWEYSYKRNKILSKLSPLNFYKKEATRYRYNFPSYHFSINFDYPVFIGFTVSDDNIVLNINNPKYLDDDVNKIEIGDKLELLDSHSEFVESRELLRNSFSVLYIRRFPPNTVHTIWFTRKNINLSTVVISQLKISKPIITDSEIIF